MLSLSFAVDTSSLAAEMPQWAQVRIPSITRNALNDIVTEGRFAEIDAIRAAFDRPTNYIATSALYEKATKENLRARVYLRDEGSRGGAPPSKILQAEIAGGARKPKAFELLLRRAGVMRADEFAVPARDLPRDAHGNIPRSLILRILRRVGGPRVRGARYFTPKPGTRSGLARGIWEETGRRSVRPVILFVTRRPTYQRRYPFGAVTIKEAERMFEPLWAKYFYLETAEGHGPALRSMGPSSDPPSLRGIRPSGARQSDGVLRA